MGEKMKFDTSKEYKTRSGKKAKVYVLDAGGPSPMHGAILMPGNGWEMCVWDPKGKRLGHNQMHPYDILGEWDAKPGRKIAFINALGLVGLFDENQVPDDVVETGTRAHWMDEPVSDHMDRLGGEQ